jgi:hypothetical protein
VILHVKNWNSFQHYKDRNPLWIKLHRQILDNWEFHALSIESKAYIPLLWLLASEHDGALPPADKAAWRLRTSADVIEKVYAEALEAGFFEAGELGTKEQWASRYIPDAVRERILQRDGHQCITCGSTENLEIDHKIPISKGGTSDELNLQVLCRSCNRRKRVRCADVEQVATQRITAVEPREEKRRDIEEREKETEPRIIFQIATSHPKLAHLRDDSEIPYSVVGVILEAIVKDGDEKVLAGTKAYAESLDDPKFASDPYKFFSQFAYRREWKRGDTKTGRFTEILNSIPAACSEPGEFSGADGSSEGPKLRV